MDAHALFHAFGTHQETHAREECDYLVTLLLPSIGCSISSGSSASHLPLTSETRALLSNDANPKRLLLLLETQALHLRSQLAGVQSPRELWEVVRAIDEEEGGAKQWQILARKLVKERQSREAESTESGSKDAEALESIDKCAFQLERAIVQAVHALVSGSSAASSDSLSSAALSARTDPLMLQVKRVGLSLLLLCESNVDMSAFWNGAMRAGHNFVRYSLDAAAASPSSNGETEASPSKTTSPTKRTPQSDVCRRAFTSVHAFFEVLVARSEEAGKLDRDSKAFAEFVDVWTNLARRVSAPWPYCASLQC